MRPKSIVRFQWSYLVFILASFGVMMLGWDAVTEELAVNPATAQLGLETMLGFVWGMTAISYAFSFLLLWLVAFKGSAVAKWIVVVFFVLFNLCSALWGIAAAAMSGEFGDIVTAPALLNLAVVAINAYAVWLLFQPDTREWFGESAGAAEEAPVE